MVVQDRGSDNPSGIPDTGSDDATDAAPIVGDASTDQPDLPSADVSAGDGLPADARPDTGVVLAPGSDQLLSSAMAGDQQSAAVAINSSGQIVVVWELDLPTGSTDAVYAQRMDSSGTLIGPAIEVGTSTAFRWGWRGSRPAFSGQHQHHGLL